MYVPSIHNGKDQEQVYDYIRHHGFATLVSQHEGRHIATHIPMYLNEGAQGNYTLLSHIAIANEQKHSFDEKQELLAIFMEQHAYISSSWYSHLNVPTWNYVSVHVYGTARVISGNELRESIEKLVDQYERGRPDRFKVDDMPHDMKEAHFKGLVGFEMKISKIESSYKLSQNRNDKDHANVISQLEKEENSGSIGIAKAMKELRKS